MSKSKQASPEELYTIYDLSLLKKSITELTKKQDYKTLNALFRCNPNAGKFDTRSLNEDIPQENKRFTKPNGKLCNVAKSTPLARTTPQDEVPEPKFYELRPSNYQGFNSRIRSRYYIT